MLSKIKSYQQDQAAEILAEADRISQKASASSEHARQIELTIEQEIQNVNLVLNSYEEAQIAFTTAMEERL